MFIAPSLFTVTEQALLSTDGGCAGLVLEGVERYVKLLEEEGQEEEVTVACLMALGNAARSDDNVVALAGHKGLMAQVLKKRKTVNEQHLCLGLLGNMSVPEEGRKILKTLGAQAFALEQLTESNNAHVMFAAVTVIRRLVAGGAEVDMQPLLEQRERLTQPEHQRIWLEICRIGCCVWGRQGGDLALCVPPLLQAEWAVTPLLSCPLLFCRVLSSCRVLSCLVLSCLVLSCLVLSCFVLSCRLVLSCLVLSCLLLCCSVLISHQVLRLEGCRACAVPQRELGELSETLCKMAVEDNDANVRLAALIALRNHPSPSHLQVLTDVAQTSDTPSVDGVSLSHAAQKFLDTLPQDK